jgi:chaperonin GroEL
MEGSVVVNKVKDGKADFGFNAATEVYENLYKAGVIDPTKVTRIALENAASIAGYAPDDRMCTAYTPD